MTFKNSHQHENALRDGITLHQHNLILHAGKLHEQTMAKQAQSPMQRQESYTFEFNLHLHNRHWDDIPLLAD